MARPCAVSLAEPGGPLKNVCYQAGFQYTYMRMALDAACAVNARSAVHMVCRFANMESLPIPSCLFRRVICRLCRFLRPNRHGDEGRCWGSRRHTGKPRCCGIVLRADSSHYKLSLPQRSDALQPVWRRWNCRFPSLL